MEYLKKIQFGTKSQVNVCLLCHKLRTCRPTWKYGHWQNNTSPWFRGVSQKWSYSERLPITIILRCVNSLAWWVNMSNKTHGKVCCGQTLMFPNVSRGPQHSKNFHNWDSLHSNCCSLATKFGTMTYCDQDSTLPPPKGQGNLSPNFLTLLWNLTCWLIRPDH